MMSQLCRRYRSRLHQDVHGPAFVADPECQVVVVREVAGRPLGLQVVEGGEEKAALVGEAAALVVQGRWLSHGVPGPTGPALRR